MRLKEMGKYILLLPKLMTKCLKKLLKILPKLRFAIINGKLNTKDIEKVYEDFFNKKIDLLISTAMIESGLDNSNVNTIIIDKPYLLVSHNCIN